jgi:hypothetical protein
MIKRLDLILNGKGGVGKISGCLVQHLGQPLKTAVGRLVLCKPFLATAAVWLDSAARRCELRLRFCVRKTCPATVTRQPSISVDSSDIKIAALNVCAEDLRSYLPSFAQLLTIERFSNPALEHETDAPPEKMLIRFAQAVVVVLGWGLDAEERELQRYELNFIMSAPRRFAFLLHSHIAAVSITFTKENA